MKGALRVAWLLFSALRIQKLLIGVGMLLIGVGYLLPVRASRPAIVMGLIIPLVPSFFIAGVLVRSFVAPQGVRLIPRVRGQMLGGMAVFTAAVATVTSVVAWTLGVDPKALPLLWLMIAALTSIVMLPQFVLSNGVWGMTTWFVTLAGVFAGVVNAPPSSMSRQILRMIVTNAPLLIAILVALWGAFAIWFLRAHSFRPPSSFGFHSAPPVNLGTTPQIALRAFLFGNPSIRFQLTGSFAAVGFTALSWGLVFVLTNGKVSFVDAALKGLGVTLGLGAYSGIGAWQVTRRSKSLWLRGGVDRMGLFRLCEAQAWKYFALAATPVLAALVMAWIIRPSVGLNYTVLLALHFCSGACLVYLGLMHVRGWRVVDIVCAFVLAAVWVMTFATTEFALSTPWLMPAIIAAMLAAALALRLAAVHRWQRIDWLVCKPPRLPARDELRLTAQ